MLNSVIKIDLHIHSIASKYKEPYYHNGESIVEHSNCDNTTVLLDNLIKNGIQLFSITDHNRFNVELYNKISNDLEKPEYSSLKLLHGVEFDVKLDESKADAHIIVIFDVTNQEDMLRIETALKENEITDKNGYYSKDQFEKILRNIKLNTILIVHQRCAMTNTEGKHKSLSEAVDNPYTIIETGYITALEYQKPNVEGIIKRNLNESNTKVALVTGSDCHDWEAYPRHDKDSQYDKSYFSQIKSLPTFKGLLLALTSPDTRFNRCEHTNEKYIKSFMINGDEVLLDPGINAIIGENGSGKSTLFHILENKTAEKYIKNLQKDNDIKVESKNFEIKAIEQSDLVEQYEQGELFFKDDTLFDSIDSTDFETQYIHFSDSIKRSIKNNISKSRAMSDLENLNFKIDPLLLDTTTFFVRMQSEELCLEENTHTSHRKILADIILKLVDEYNDCYYKDEDKNSIYKAIVELKKLYTKINEKEISIDNNNRVKNIIIKECVEYNTEIDTYSTSEDKQKGEYQSSENKFCTSIVNAIKFNTEKSLDIKQPSKISGMSRKSENGYVFEKETNYNETDVVGKYLGMMFTKNYRSFPKLLEIDSFEKLKDAIIGCTENEKIDAFWESNYKKFIEWAKTEKTYIKEASSHNSIGSTLGEMSLIYYKFQTSLETSYDILMIDQPEDNISNKRIAERLLAYFENIRKHKQLIIVTHNPLLVVNLDVDNVIHLTKTNNTIEVKSGCLEDEENGILELISKSLDGGKEMIERRLKIYE
jgi:predicted ATPase